MNGLSLHQWWWRTAILVLIAVWRIYQTGRRPSLPSAMITTAFLATAASLVVEAMVHAETDDPDGRPYVLASIQVLILLVAWCATVGYYAHADGTRRGWRIAVGITGFAAVSGVLIVTAAALIPHTIRRGDFQHVEVLRYYVAVFSFFPLAQALSSYLALRTAGRATGALRAALLLAAAGLALLAVAGYMFLADVFIQYGGQHPPQLLAVGERRLYWAGAVLWIVSFGAVAAAHRSRQLAAGGRAVRENRLLRGLLRDLEAMSPPTLAYPRTGHTPLLMRPHAMLLRTRIECRDRLLTLSPLLGEVLAAEERQHPDTVAAALAQLHARHDPTSPARPATPVAILTSEDPGTDPLVELAHSYARTRLVPQ
ncbi:hypothetical protein [Nocardia sp. NPDC127526]|uniref:hypothetical protein n=1 Tax=Nocardia sp. NPDC127526 TaxID=3345393 RepID=UPI00362A8CAC